MGKRALLDEGVQHLRQTMLPSGGWGYHARGQLFVEPTALALLALAPRDPPSKPTAIDGDEPAAASLRALLSCQRPEGFFGTAAEDPDASWATAPALLALLAHGHRERASTAAEWLARWYAPSQPPVAEMRKRVRDLLKIDFAIRGWPWQAGEEFATVEPTSLAAIALRAWGEPAGAERIAETLRYLADRACPAGGWNYGNPYFYENRLSPITLPTTKGLLALALCGSAKDVDLASQAAGALARLLEDNPSRKAHAWATLAFAASRDVKRAVEHAGKAVDSGDGRGAWGGGPDAHALAVLALRAADGEVPRCLSWVRA